MNRDIFIRIEKPLYELEKQLNYSLKMVAAKDQIISSNLKIINSICLSITKSFYHEGLKLKGSPFEKLIKQWGDPSLLPITVQKEELKEIEKTLDHNAKLPPSYTSAVSKHGLPTFSDEFAYRINDVNKFEFNDADGCRVEFLPIKRFLPPAEIMDKSLWLSAKIKKPPINIVFATDLDGNLLCFENAVKPENYDPPHDGAPDAIYNIANDEYISDWTGLYFKDWISNYLLIKPLNTGTKVFKSLGSEISNLHDTVNKLKQCPEYKDNQRYHHSIDTLSQNINELFSCYKEALHMPKESTQL